jgi:hypothetical protein
VVTVIPASKETAPATDDTPFDKFTLHIPRNIRRMRT